MMRALQNWCLAVMAGWLLCGCGKSKSAPQIQALPITGIVTLDGKPLSGAEVVFLPPDSAAVFADTTKDDGTYQLQGLAGKANCQGKCKVTISHLLKSDGTPIPAGEAPANAGAGERLPARYSQPAFTELIAEVPESGGNFDFPLKST